MSKLSDHDSVNNNVIRERDSDVVTLQTTSQSIEDHGRLAIFVENSGKADYFSKSKKRK